ncbi:hypothetical protein GGTG_11951 [Gaeumannomyces tritici R3-111a-1]|uniref:Uncharacterized protein n=1 Tax=Gaeumannomyces tritici (strain R3-111a-1) TaxID=644352 RepID=J3PEM0_GAET3|nr:hypothetical protein GGTG_11951 [Gaeumannomyces tritici R3-111a-1]EJT70928.1 hypothetical protein GGTG_11951 [Gaeumannomyces tritici R3-111a-1]
MQLRAGSETKAVVDHVACFLGATASRQPARWRDGHRVMNIGGLHAQILGSAGWTKKADLDLNRPIGWSRVFYDQGFTAKLKLVWWLTVSGLDRRGRSAKGLPW